MFTKTYDWESHESFEELLKSKIISKVDHIAYHDLHLFKFQDIGQQFKQK
jgi:hypothetical protein